MWHSSGTGRTLGLKLNRPCAWRTSKALHALAACLLTDAIPAPAGADLRADAQPGGQVRGVGQRGRQAHEADRLLGLRGDVAHARDNHLKDRAPACHALLAAWLHVQRCSTLLLSSASTALAWQRGAPVGAQEVDLVDNQQADLLHVRARVPGAADAVPLLRRGDDDVCGQQRAHVRRVVPGQLHQPLAQRLAQAGAPVLDALAHQRLRCVNT